MRTLTPLAAPLFGPSPCASFTLIVHRVPDGTTPTPGRDTACSLVKLSDGLDFAALPTGLPPDTVSEFAPAMDAFVSERVNQFKVVDVVVEFVPVTMMDLMPRRDRPVVLLPNNNVFHSETAFGCVVDTPITFGSDCPVPTRSLTCWSSFAHVAPPELMF